MDEPRFNPNHGATGSGKGGQFVAAGGGGGGSKTPASKAPAKKPPPGKAPAGKAAPGHGKPPPAHTPREHLLAEAHADREKAAKLEKQLHVLEKQHAAAVAAAKHAGSQAAKAKAAGHVVHHRKHTAAHKHHHKHAASLATRIGHLRTEIHTLRQKAAALEKQAKGKRDAAPGISVTERMRAAGMITNPGGTEKLHEYWVHGEGAAKIAWGTPGDFDRCVMHLGKFIKDPQGYCAKAHHDALGIWPATHAAQMSGHKSAEIPGDDRAAKPYGNVTYADPKNGKYPIDTKAHAAAAWSYINMPKNAAQYPVNGVTLSSVKARIVAACRKFGIEVKADAMNSTGLVGEERTIPLIAPLDVTANGDGLTFEGYAAVYNRTARISAADGDFDEQIAPGAFRAIAAGAYPKLMFDHGRHPLIGTMPLGKITDAREDDTGLWIEARLTDNWLISPVRDAVANGALDGMSFRFTVDDGGELWMDRSGDVPLRSLTSVSVPELGPVVFPAYEPTTASVRSVLDNLPVIGRPAAGAAAASDRGGDALVRAEPDPSLTARFRRDGEALALRGIEGVRI